MYIVYHLLEYRPNFNKNVVEANFLLKKFAEELISRNISLMRDNLKIFSFDKNFVKS